MCLFKPNPRPDASDENVDNEDEGGGGGDAPDEVTEFINLEAIAGEADDFEDRHGGTGRLGNGEEEDEEFSPPREDPAEDDAPKFDGGGPVVFGV